MNYGDYRKLLEGLDFVENSANLERKMLQKEIAWELCLDLKRQLYLRG